MQTEHVVAFAKRHWFGIVVGSSISLGLAFIFIGSVFGSWPPHSPAPWGQQWWIDFAGYLGGLFLVSGVLATFTRFFALSGEFRSALADIVTSPAVIANRKDAIVIWENLTMQLHLQDFKPRDSEDITFLRELNSTISGLFTPRPYFFRNCVANHTISMIEGSNVQITTTFHYDLVYLVGPSTLTVDIGFHPSEAANHSDYSPEPVEVYDDDKKIPVVSERRGDALVSLFHLSGKHVYKILRKRSFVQDIAKDSTYRFISTCIVYSIDVTVSCFGDIATNFIEIGTPEEAFEDLRGDIARRKRPGDQRRRFRGILLPRQGYVITMVPN